MSVSKAGAASNRALPGLVYELAESSAQDAGALLPPEAPAPTGQPAEMPPWAAEIPCSLEAWPELRARWGGLPGVRLAWPEGAAGLVAVVASEGLLKGF